MDIFVKNVGVDLLRKQRDSLVNNRLSILHLDNDELLDVVDGVTNLLDAMLDNSDDVTEAATKQAEFMALGQFLSDWPDMEFSEIMEALESDKYLDIDDLVIWQPFENYDGYWLAEEIESTKDAHVKSLTEFIGQSKKAA